MLWETYTTHRHCCGKKTQWLIVTAVVRQLSIATCGKTTPLLITDVKICLLRSVTPRAVELLITFLKFFLSIQRTCRIKYTESFVLTQWPISGDDCSQSTQVISILTLERFPSKQLQARTLWSDRCRAARIKVWFLHWRFPTYTGSNQSCSRREFYILL